MLNPGVGWISSFSPLERSERETMNRVLFNIGGCGNFQFSIANFQFSIAFV
jgi:hypothetical protein